MTGIVILNYNNSSQTESCLKSLYCHCHDGTFKVCVVDNASRQEELAKLQSFCREHIVIAGENGGYACGNDLGCEWFDTDPQVDKILILNDDTRFTENILPPMEAYLDSHPECGVVFPLVKAPDGSVDKACARRSKSLTDLFLQATCLGRFGIKRSEFMPTEGLEAHDSIVTGVPPGSCMMLRKSQFKEIGWLDRHTFLYFEEHILSEKLKNKGLKCILLPKISIIHLGAQTTQKQPSKAIYGHWRDSYLYYLENYSSMPEPITLWLRFRTWLKLVTTSGRK